MDLYLYRLKTIGISSSMTKTQTFTSDASVCSLSFFFLMKNMLLFLVTGLRWISTEGSALVSFSPDRSIFYCTLVLWMKCIINVCNVCVRGWTNNIPVIRTRGTGSTPPKTRTLATGAKSACTPWRGWTSGSYFIVAVFVAGCADSS